jgi:hypothetical protein
LPDFLNMYFSNSIIFQTHNTWKFTFLLVLTVSILLCLY